MVRTDGRAQSELERRAVRPISSVDGDAPIHGGSKLNLVGCSAATRTPDSRRFHLGFGLG
ncbi:MAG: hypothetical protein JWO42_903, partial [Chloroflexi bacterium]|nr:hypothetical protein [Chloroflexota bacterium]